MGKMNSKQSQMLIAILIVGVLVIVFQFGYKPIASSAKEVSTKNKELQSTLNELIALQENEVALRAELSEVQDGLNQITNRYAVKFTPQKSIVMINEMQTFADVTVNSMSFNTIENIYTSTFTNANGEYLTANKSVLNVSYTTSYAGLKRCMEFLNAYADHVNVVSLASAYNQESGLLSGTLDINLYTLDGLGRVYEDPGVGGVNISLDNIFKTMK